MAVLIPWDHVKAILSTHGDTLQVICLALPCQPILVYTSKLLQSLFPHQGFKETINGFVALRLYMVCWQYFRQTLEESDSPYWERVEVRLKQDQTALLEHCDEHPNHEFLLSYLHAYEVAITKCMHLKRLLQPEFKDDQASKDLTEPILLMDSQIIKSLGIRDYLTKTTLPTPTDMDNDMIQQMIKQQSLLQSEMDTIAATADDKRSSKESAEDTPSSPPITANEEPESEASPSVAKNEEPESPVEAEAPVAEIAEGVSDLKL